MNTFIKLSIVAVLLGTLTLVVADPIHTLNWTKPPVYVDGTAIPAMDTLINTIYCGTTSGGPYPVSFPVADPTAPPLTQDFVNLVGGNPGTYYCVIDTYSTFYDTRGEVSNEVNFTVAPIRVPAKIVDFRIQ